MVSPVRRSSAEKSGAGSPRPELGAALRRPTTSTPAWRGDSLIEVVVALAIVAIGMFAFSEVIITAKEVRSGKRAEIIQAEKIWVTWKEFLYSLPSICDHIPGVVLGSSREWQQVFELHEDDWRQVDRYTYGLYGTPTTLELGLRIAELEGARAVVHGVVAGHPQVVVTRQ